MRIDFTRMRCGLALGVLALWIISSESPQFPDRWGMGLSDHFQSKHLLVKNDWLNVDIQSGTPATNTEAVFHRATSSVLSKPDVELGEAELDLDPTESFSPWLENLVSQIDAGKPTRIISSVGGKNEVRVIGWRPLDLFGDDFALTVGTDMSADWGIRVYRGVNTNSSDEGSGERYTMAIVQNAIFTSIEKPDGSQIRIQNAIDGGGSLNAVLAAADHAGFQCQHDPVTGRCEIKALAQESDPIQQTGTADILIESADDPHILGQGGFNPHNGKVEKFVKVIPYGDAYLRSLKPMLMVGVLDKLATSGTSDSILHQKTSEWLAMISNVASVYENQLGIRLLLQELILTPRSSTFEDIPASLDEFRVWCNRYRPQSQYRWSTAVKWGTGLNGSSLGVAYVRSIQSASAVGLMRHNTGWATAAHEIGHNLGSEHSNGGIMNSFDNGGGNRDFFTEIENLSVTSAFAIYNHAASRLPGEGVEMRNPNEIPFAENDKAATSGNRQIRIPVLANDKTSVRNGAENNIKILEVGSIFPGTAGEVTIDGETLLFQPASEFRGTAYFSYTIQGDVGNGGNGWLHKGDVAVVVDRESSVDSWTLAPGDSISFTGKRSGAVRISSKPTKSLVHVDRDDDSLIVIRADKNASGIETFQYTQGGATITVRLLYAGSASSTTTDVILYDKSMGAVTINPLANDFLAGNIGVDALNLSKGVGTSGQTSLGIAPFDWVSHLVSVRNMHTRKGKMETEMIASAARGVARQQLTGNVTFTPEEDASGIASLRYIAEDGSGRRKTDHITFIFSLAEIVSPKADVVGLESGEMLVLRVEEQSEAVPPLSGSVELSWNVNGGEKDMDYQFIESAGEGGVAVFTASSPGKYVLEMVASDNGYSTSDTITVIVGEPGIRPGEDIAGLFGHWPLDSLAGGSFPDASGRNRNIFHRNIDVLLAGVNGNGVRLNGNDEYLRLTPYVDALSELSEGAISLWFRTDVASRQVLFSATHFINREQFYDIVLENGHIVVERSSGNTSRNHKLSVPGRYDDGQWHHILLSCETSGKTSVYIDGGRMVQGIVPFLRGLHKLDDITIGVTRNGNDFHGYFDGVIDEVRIYQSPLPEEKVASLSFEDLSPSSRAIGGTTSLVVPVGEIDPALFDFSDMDSNEPRREWIQVQGPAEITTSDKVWIFPEEGDYRFYHVSGPGEDGVEVAASVQIKVVPGSLPFAWGIPEFTVAVPQEGKVTLPLADSIIGLKQLVPDQKIPLQFMVEDSDDLPLSQLLVDDAGLILLPDANHIPIGRKVIKLGVAEYPGISFPVSVHFARDQTGFPRVNLAVKEDIEAGVELIQLSRHLKITGPVYFALPKVPGNAAGIVDLDSRTGRVSLSPGARLNYEDQSRYHVEIEVVTSGRTGILPLVIDVRDVDEPMSIANQVFQVGLGDSRSEVGVIEYNDPENREPEFRIVDGDPFDLFSISHPGGILSISKPDALSDVSEGVVTLKVEAYENGNIESDPVTFDVIVLSPVSAIDGKSERSVKVPTSDRERLLWTQPNFNDASWDSGVSGVGYERGNGYERWIGMDVEAEMFGENQSVYIRIPFTVDDPTKVNSLLLRMFYDDGFVAYINGKEVASSNAPGSPMWDSGATRSHSDRLALLPEDHFIPAGDLLRRGGNILAVHGMNSSLSSTDMLIFPELYITRNPGDHLPLPVRVEISDVTQDGFGRFNLSADIQRDRDHALDLTLFYGMRNGGEDPRLWEHSISLGNPSSNSITRSIGNLREQGFYFLALRSNSPHGESWSKPAGIELIPDERIRLVSPYGQVQYVLPEDDRFGRDWRNLVFDDSTWNHGFSGIGYEAVNGFESLIATSVQEEMRHELSSLYARYLFYVPDGYSLHDPSLEVMYDDGFAAWINGGKVAGANDRPEADMTWNARSSGSNADAAAVLFESFPFEETEIEEIVTGWNILAIHAMNTSPSSSDFLIRPHLTGRLVRNAQRIPRGDQDMDGLPDIWEISRFGSLVFNGFQDNDKDGVTNFDEFVQSSPAVTDPEGPTPDNDRFLTEVEIGYDSNESVIRLTWPNNSVDAMGGIVVETSGDLVEWEPLTLPGAPVSDDSFTSLFIPLPGNDNQSPRESHRFFRILKQQ